MKGKISFRIVVMTCAFFGTIGAGVLSAQQPPTHYIYKHDRIELQLDPSALAVQYDLKTTSTQQISDAAAAGVRTISTRSLGFGFWNVHDLQKPFNDASEANIQIKKLVGSPDVKFVSPVFRGSNNSPIIITPDILVQLKSEYIANAPSLLQTIAADADIVTENFGNMKGAFKLHSRLKSGFDVLATANRLVEGGYAEWSEPDMIITGRGELIPNDPLFPKLWGIHNTGQFGGTPGADMKGDLAWNITTGDTSVKVMVIDCGVQQDHPDIHQRPGMDFTGQGGGGGPVNSCDNHGTAVAGCVSAIINNGVGVVGIAPTCYVISARTLIANSSCDNTFMSQISWTVNALAYAGSNGIRITNFSNQFFTAPSSALEAEYQYTHDSLNVVHFAAAGNGNTSIYYPASIPVVNAVTALNSTGSLASFSNHGVGLDFSAPGDSIYTTDRTGSAGFTSGDYINYRGTSFASPYVAGVAALILSRFPTFTATQVEQKLQNSCVDLGTQGYDLTYGWGFVNAYNAIRSSCIIIPPTNITTPVDPGQCGAIVNFPTPVTTGNCSPVTCTPPSGSFFTVGTTTVICADTSGDHCIFTVTVTGGSIASGVLRDDFNRADGPLLGTNKWVLIQNQPSGGSMAVVNNAMQPTSTGGNLNYGGIVWDSLVSAGTEASITVTQKSGNTNNSSLFIYARMNNKDFNTGTGYRLRFLEQSGADLIEIQKVGPGYSTSSVLASTNIEINSGDFITFRVLCDNKTMVGLVNGVM
ncbi:MAG: S8 family serine peptidase [Ignavibacteria bacterium]|nr:S8 family serine peptidase [Ignavibacteria bacterium]